MIQSSKLSHWVRRFVDEGATFFRSPVNVFVMLASVFGMLIVFVTPPLTGADEEAHFVRAYGIVQGDLRLYNTNKVEMPKSYRQTIGCLQTGNSTAGKTYTYDYDTYVTYKRGLVCSLHVPLNPNSTEMVRTSAGSYFPTTYIPQVVVIAIGKFFEMPIVVMVYLVRIAVLLTYILLIVFALKLLPVRKWALVGVSLLPHAINQITNPGGDYILFGMTAIITAVVVRSVYISQKNLKKENRFLLTVLAIAMLFLVLVKGPFPGICILPLIAFYGGWKYERVNKIIIAIISMVIGLMWYEFGVLAVASWRTGVPVSIFDFPNAFINTMFFHWVETDFVQVGYNANTGDVLGMPSIIISMLNMLLAFYLFSDYKEKIKIRLNEREISLLRLTSILIAVGIVVGSFAALFISASYLQENSMVINGVQTRYFYPALFMLALIPFIRNFTIKSTEKFISTLTIGSAILLSAQVMLLAIRFPWS